MNTSTDNSRDAITELEGNISTKLNTLKSKVGELEEKLLEKNLSAGDDDGQIDGIDIDKLITRKIENINLPLKIQHELGDIKAEPDEAFIKRLISESISSIDFGKLIQEELAKLEPVTSTSSADTGMEGSELELASPPQDHTCKQTRDSGTQTTPKKERTTEVKDLDQKCRTIENDICYLKSELRTLTLINNTSKQSVGT